MLDGRFDAVGRRVFLSLFATVLGFAPPQAFGLGADYGPDDLKMHAALIGGQTPVHGYWVNWEDVFYYAGDAAAFNQFIEAYSQFRHRQLKVVVHRGPKQAASPWKQFDIPADWSLYVWNTGANFIPKIQKSETGDEQIEYEPIGPPSPTRVDIWVGPRLPLSALRIPASLPVTADAVQDTEIQEYISERKSSSPAGTIEGGADVERDVFLLSLELADGSRLRGESAGVKVLPLETPVGKVSIPAQQIAEVGFRAEPGIASVEFDNGDRLSGTVNAAEWGDQRIQTLLGEIVVPFSLIRRYRIEGIVGKPMVSVRASGSWEVSVPERAFDGRRDTDWNSGNYAPGWIEADLSSTGPLSGIRLVPAQDITGPTTHEVWISDKPIGDDRGKARLMHTFAGETANAMELRCDFPEHTTARYVQVRTTQSPTWISWWEVRIRTAKQQRGKNRALWP